MVSDRFWLHVGISVKDENLMYDCRSSLHFIVHYTKRLLPFSLKRRCFRCERIFCVFFNQCYHAGFKSSIMNWARGIYGFVYGQYDFAFL